MVWNPFKGGRYDLSKTVASILPGGDRAGIYVHGKASPQAAESQSVTQPIGGFSTMADKPQEVIAQERAAQEAAMQEQAIQQAMTQQTGATQAAPTEYVPNTQFIDGTPYDLNDPGQFQAYIAKADEILNRDFEDFSKRAKDLSEQDIAEAKAQEDEINFNIERALAKISEQEGQYNTDFARSVSDLSEGFRQGSARRQATYAAMAPRVFQSSQMTSQNYAENKFKDAQTRLGEDKTRAMQGFGEARQDYARQGQNASNQFNLFKTRREAQAKDEIANQSSTVRGNRDQAMAGAFNYAGQMRKEAPNASKWSTPQFQERNLNYSPSQVNLNDLMSFIKFQPQTGFTGGMGQMKTGAIATPEAGGESLQNYMYGNTQQEESPLNLYKQGKSY